MSEDNVALIRKLYERMPSPRDEVTEDLQELLGDSVDPEFEMHLPQEYPEGLQVVRGRAGRDKLAGMLQETWREWRVVPERFFDAGDRVVVFARLIAVGQESGVTVEVEPAHIWTIRDGRAVSMHIYLDRAKALEEAGLPEDATGEEAPHVGQP